MNLTKMFTFEKSQIDVSTKTLASTKAIQKSLRPAWYERLWIWNHLLLLLLLRRLGLELRNGRVIPHVQLLGRGCVGVGGMLRRGATTLWKKVRRTQPKIFFFSKSLLNTSHMRVRAYIAYRVTTNEAIWQVGRNLLQHLCRVTL